MERNKKKSASITPGVSIGSRAPRAGKQGYSLVELLIALTIFTLTISAVVFLFYGGQDFTAGGLTAQNGADRVRTSGEALRFIRDNNWASMTNGIHGLQLVDNTWQLTDTPDVANGFTRTVSLSTDIDGIKHATVTVAWQAMNVGTQSTSIYETLAPPNQGLNGDWTQPCVLTTLDAGSGSKGTDIAYLNNRVYVTNSSSSSGKDDLYIFDVTSSRSPSLLGSLDIEEGLRSVAVSGGAYAYVIEGDSPDFFVVDVSNPVAPVKKSRLVVAAGAKGRVVAVSGNYAYVGLTATAGEKEFFVIDISDPLNPTVAASLEIGGDVNAISLSSTTAYLATSLDSQELVIVDITNPLSISQTGSYDAVGNADGTGVNAKTLKRVYLSRNGSSDPDLFILDVTNPASVTSRGSSDTSGNTFDILTAGTLAYVGSDTPNEEFQNYFVKDPSAIVQFAQLNLSNVGRGIAYNNNIIYMAVQNSDLLQIITSTINGICGG